MNDKGIKAYIDEFGSYGFDFNNEGNTTHFILSAIVIKNSEVPELETKVEEIRKTYFQNGEMKSKMIGKNHNRRKVILNKLIQLPFSIMVFVVDKRKIYEQSGIRYKHTFYKYLNQVFYDKLCVLYPQLDIYADQVGGNEFITSFLEYAKKRKNDIGLFDQHSINGCDSKKSILVQVADIISGSLAYNFDERKKIKSEGNDYLSLLKDKIASVTKFPLAYEDMLLRDDLPDDSSDRKIADICYRQAQDFINKNSASSDTETKQQTIVLNYLLFRFLNNSSRKYIPTNELLRSIEAHGYKRPSEQQFRNQIIAKLRDHNVIIASSKKGMKIPSKKSEVLDFVNHSKNIIIPMLSRLNTCCELIKAGTLGDIDLLEEDGNELLKKIVKSM